ncbi:MAG: DHH family phosphoesterase [Desulfovibrio sp.]|jgi:nanoRNase/pAp phosphatase (c-di-AMP/oligoRNAs hydrolase)|nr:DHH family phosphoesterase [Desulfovibrio sp.]
MSYFRAIPRLPSLMRLFSREDRWLILINADPDAMASALALRRILSRRVHEAVIAKVNAVTRPDNLAMIRYARIHMEDFSPDLPGRFSRLALVDSQPGHHALFRKLPFTLVIDHHPLESPVEAEYCDIRPEYGATSTLLTEYLYNLGVRPGKLLATALQFGIKTDTASFERHFSDVDLRAFRHLSRYADQAMLLRIARSAFHRRWLGLLARACAGMYSIKSGQYAFVGEVDNPDILVVVADFLMQVYEIRWVAVAGVYGETVVIIFRSDGVSRDVGRFAAQISAGIGSGGGHKVMARAEFSLSVTEGADAEMFIWRRLNVPLKAARGASPQSPPPGQDVA